MQFHEIPGAPPAAGAAQGTIAGRDVGDEDPGRTKMANIFHWHSLWFIMVQSSTLVAASFFAGCWLWGSEGHSNLEISPNGWEEKTPETFSHTKAPSGS